MAIVINGSGTVTGLDADGISSAPTNATDSTKLPLAGGTMTGTIAGFTSTGIDDNADATAITINSSEQVGIGLTSPDTTLHIKGSAQIAKLETTSGTGQNYIRFADSSGDKAYFGFASGANDHLTLFNQENADIAFGTNDTERMRINSSGNVGIGTSSPASTQGFGHLLEISDGDSGTSKDSALVLSSWNGSSAENKWEIGNNTGGNLQFIHSVAGDGSTGTKMVIDASGNLGIGHTTPQFGLTIAQGSGDSSRIGWEDSGNSKRASIICHTSSDALQFHTGTSDTERMRINSSGKVAIGTTNTYGKLDVATSSSSTNYSGSSAIRTGVDWDSETATHTISYPDYCVGDTVSGMLVVHAKADGSGSGAKAGTLLLLFVKTHGEGLQISTLHSLDQKISSFSASTSSNNIVITTDSDCAVTWQSFFGR